MLLEHGREVVPREDLQKRLWPADTSVDFDEGLNKAINKIREALGESAENPRFVETVARRGYRFLAEVTVVGAPPGKQSQAPKSKPFRKPGNPIAQLPRQAASSAPTRTFAGRLGLGFDFGDCHRMDISLQGPPIACDPFLGRASPGEPVG